MPNKNSIYRRAEAYARGQVNTGGHAVGDHGPLATGWRAGYRAALRDIRRTMEGGTTTTAKLARVVIFLHPRR